MQIDKQTVLDSLRERGRSGKIELAKQRLPDQVDHEQHAGLLQELGIDARELLNLTRPGGHHVEDDRST
jgi:hypothetical protein